MDFINSLAPPDSVTFRLAVLAFIVALGSLLLSIAAVSRVRVSRPFWATDYDAQSEGFVKGTRTRVTYRVQNRGPGDALDVSLKVVTVDGTSALESTSLPVGHWDAVGYGQSAEVRFFREDSADLPPLSQVQFGSDPNVHWEGAIPRRVELEVTWSEAPRTRLRRFERFTIELPARSWV
ncbi:hypothetical protein J2X85_003883 [Microbacterium trichothecenolyticum]|uniref:hypothetical protein n=1 Tax=Microbacterium trichothecenolyticum TaxID=69370 RepID=UPI002863F325|nr:hypothetical protein [Microbacterium trichothecenolyticum]MDR7186822.1 hypothetical protein [Microbacterium trichothecenolyticum]